jgi:hypothetical protein
MGMMPDPLCMFCGEQSNPDLWGVVCSRRCLRALRRGLGMPHGPAPGRKGERIIGRCFVVDSSDVFNGLCYQEVGLVFFGEEIGLDVAPTEAPHPMILRRSSVKEDNAEIITYFQVWLALVRMPDSPIVVKAQWYPSLERTVFSFEDVPYNVTKDQLTSARQVLTLWRAGELVGRRLGSTQRTPEEFLTQLKQELRRAGYDPTWGREYLPTQDALADRIGISTDTLQRYLRDLGLGWPPDLDMGC